MDKASQKLGTRIRVKIPKVRFSGGELENELFTTLAREIRPSGWTHYLYKSVPGITLNADGDTYAVDFEATITGSVKTGPSVTTEVTDANDVRHFVYLSSSLVTAVSIPVAGYAPAMAEEEEEQEEEPAADQGKAITGPGGEVTNAVGTLIRVQIPSVRFDTGTGELGTTEARETSGGGWTHYLYKPSLRITANQGGFGTYAVDFEAKITGEAGESVALTTEVVETVTGVTHFVFLPSTFVTVVPEKSGVTVAPSDEVRAVLLVAEEVINSEAKDVKAMAVDEYKDIIRAGELREAIAEAEAELMLWTAKRVRNGEIIARFTSEDEVDAYIDQEDYDPKRVQAVRDEDGEIPLAVRQLRELQADCESSMDDWDDDEAAILNESFCDGDWARNEFVEMNEVTVDLGVPPFVYINWEDHADYLLEDRPSVTFRGVTFYQS